MRKFSMTVGELAFIWLYVEVTSIVNGELSFCTELFRTVLARKIELGRVD